MAEQVKHPSILQRLAAQGPSEQELLVLYLIAFGGFLFRAFPWLHFVFIETLAPFHAVTSTAPLDSALCL